MFRVELVGSRISEGLLYVEVVAEKRLLMEILLYGCLLLTDLTVNVH